MPVIQTPQKTKTFLEYGKLEELSHLDPPSESEFFRILQKARELRGLTTEEAALLLACTEEESLRILLETAQWVKNEIYGKRLVLFAPLYISNYCTNDCLYCGFRRSNLRMHRRTLSLEEIAQQTRILLEQGHKRILLIAGESDLQTLSYTLDAIRTCYNVRVPVGSIRLGRDPFKDAGHRTAQIRRINVELAPLDVQGYRALKKAQIGTYVCFQETYDPELYQVMHPSGPKADYRYRLYCMDRAMEGGINDVGIGALFGLGPYRYEVLGLLEHAKHLEETFGCGPHTVSVPRVEPAVGAPLSQNPPKPVRDQDFKKLIAVIRVALPYTGIILSTRERPELRQELFAYGVSQISAGSKTDPGGYGSHEEEASQFTVGDHRTLAEVIDSLIDDGYIPSFCTGCYRRGRVGADFMDLAKPGLIKKFCLPNGLITFAEYLYDFAPPDVLSKGLQLIDSLKNEAPSEVKPFLDEALRRTALGERDLYL
ncbi:MAG: [FeFe] hydrogenase H-cluster radical SAM maturase HydG [Spirochaetes bacterium]|nr:[FeFe] hydrogenase H-cluster radical SAM maturase HydG [Spirochaetota bacterium]